MRMVDGKLHTATPDELFDQFSEVSVSLPDSASSWTLQLCSSYLSALTSDFSEAITSEKILVMPDLSILTSKSLQLDALRTVRSQASTSYHELQKEKEKMTTLLHNLNTTRNRGLDLATQGNHRNLQDYSMHWQKYYQQGPSQAENTLQRYNGGGDNNNARNRFKNINCGNVETRTHPSTGLQHPYDKERDFLS